MAHVRPTMEAEETERVKPKMLAGMPVAAPRYWWLVLTSREIYAWSSDERDAMDRMTERRSLNVFSRVVRTPAFSEPKVVWDDFFDVLEAGFQAREEEYRAKNNLPLTATLKEHGLGYAVNRMPYRKAFAVEAPIEVPPFELGAMSRKQGRPEQDNPFGLSASEHAARTLWLRGYRGENLRSRT